MEIFEVFPSQQLGYQGRSRTSRQIDKHNFQTLCLGTRSKEKLHFPSHSTIGLASKTRLLKSIDKEVLCLGHPLRHLSYQDSVSWKSLQTEETESQDLLGFLLRSDLSSQVVALGSMTDNTVPLFLSLE